MLYNIMVSVEAFSNYIFQNKIQFVVKHGILTVHNWR